MYLHCFSAYIHFTGILWMAQPHRNGGSIGPEHWLSLIGTVAQNAPEYSSGIKVSVIKNIHLENY